MPASETRKWILAGLLILGVGTGAVVAFTGLSIPAASPSNQGTDPALTDTRAAPTATAGPSTKTTEAPTGGSQHTPASETTAESAATTTEPGPTEYTYSVSHASSVDRNYTAAVRRSFQFWHSKPGGDDDVVFEYTADPSTADYHFQFVPPINECEGEAAETRFLYCTETDAQSGQTAVSVSAIYEASFMRSTLRYLSGSYLGYEAPADYQGVENISAVSPRYIDPWPLQSEIVVNLSVEVDSDRDWASMVRRGIDFWNRNDEQYGTYTETVEFEPTAARADVTVRIVDEIPECGIHGDPDSTTLGCADVLNKTHLATGPESIRIVDGYTEESTVSTIKHEFGHLFGVEHGEPPMPIMNETSADAQRLPKPNTSERANPFRTGPIEVYVDYESFTAPRSRVEAQARHAVAFYDDGADGHVSRDVAVRTTRNRSAAEIIVRESQITECPGTGDGSCGPRHGQDIDPDEELEYYTRQNITLSGIETDAIGWHIGYWMGYSVGGANSQADLPAVFRDAEYDDRRNWWR